MITAAFADRLREELELARLPARLAELAAARSSALVRQARAWRGRSRTRCGPARPAAP